VRRSNASLKCELRIEFAFRLGTLRHVSLAEIKKAVDTLSPGELAELAAFIRQREGAAWDRQIDSDFAEDGRLRSVVNEGREDIRSGKIQDLP
jgi:hypothetical protein